DRARLNNVKLPDRFELGFDEFTTSLPDTPVTPLLGQELSQIQMLINILLDAKVDSVTSFHRAPISEEHKGSPTPTPSPSPGQRIAARESDSANTAAKPAGESRPAKPSRRAEFYRGQRAHRGFSHDRNAKI